DTGYSNSRFQQFIWNKISKKEYKSGFKPIIFYNYNDKLYLGAAYEFVKHNEGKMPYASLHGVYAHYSIPQNAFSFGYYGTIKQAVGNWDLLLNADYDVIRWNNFFGIGNETTDDPGKQLTYYRVRSHEGYAAVSLSRDLGSSNIRFTPFFSATQIINDEGRFLSDYTKSLITARTINSPIENSYDWDTYAGIGVNYSLLQVDDEIVPRKGLALGTGAAYTKSLEAKRSFNTFNGQLNFYIPFTHQLIFASRNGGEVITGEPKFYQLTSIGGSPNVRGYYRDRYQGTSSAYTSNELQWLFNVRSKIYNGTIAPFAFYDIGRVWDRGEDSQLWYSGYGAGLIIAPFNKVSIVASYGISKDHQVAHLGLRKAL
ncbi:MAG TPA: ShlB/FhaC/HecB family hemolysin secretion/activation protein, partial [Chitinophagaceae bacterium]|nr:ShlB/FhaC/HecB family hemolysin secretion/activation protein [Chitinophagaceae bacterium]